MINMSHYTSAAEVRAILGVSVFELSDETVALPLYTQVLQTRLRTTIGTFGTTTGTLIDMFDALYTKSPLTAAEEDFLFLIKQYASYLVAEACLTGLSLYAPKHVGDGKTAGTRFSSEATFRDVSANVRRELSRLSARIAEGLGVQDSIISRLSRVRPYRDVVTDELA